MELTLIKTRDLSLHSQSQVYMVSSQMIDVDRNDRTRSTNEGTRGCLVYGTSKRRRYIVQQKVDGLFWAYNIRYERNG